MYRYNFLRGFIILPFLFISHLYAAVFPVIGDIYEDADFWAEESTITYSFEKPKKQRRKKDEDEASAYALEKTEETIKAAEDGNTFVKKLFYNSKSEIVSIMSGYYPIKAFHTPYKSRGIFHNDIKTAIFGFSFNDSEESKSYTTVKKYKDFKYLTSAYFHDYYPAKEKKIVFEIPSWINIELKEMNFEGYNIDKSEKTDSETGNRVITFTLKEIPAEEFEYNPPGPSYR